MAEGPSFETNRERYIRLVNEQVRRLEHKSAGARLVYNFFFNILSELEEDEELDKFIDEEVIKSGCEWTVHLINERSAWDDDGTADSIRQEALRLIDKLAVTDSPRERIMYTFVREALSLPAGDGCIHVNIVKKSDNHYAVKLNVDLEGETNGGGGEHLKEEESEMPCTIMPFPVKRPK